MLANVVCWGIAMGLLFCEKGGLSGNNEKMLFAMGFILLGTISKAVDVYRETHTVELNVEEDENGKIVLSKK